MARERSRPAACVHLLLAGVGGARPAPKADIRAAGLRCYRSASTRCGGLLGRDGCYGLFVPNMPAE